MLASSMAANQPPPPRPPNYAPSSPHLPNPYSVPLPHHAPAAVPPVPARTHAQYPVTQHYPPAAHYAAGMAGEGAVPPETEFLKAAYPATQLGLQIGTQMINVGQDYVSKNVHPARREWQPAVDLPLLSVPRAQDVL